MNLLINRLVLIVDIHKQDNEENAVGIEVEGGEEAKDMEPLRDQVNFLPLLIQWFLIYYFLIIS